MQAYDLVKESRKELVDKLIDKMESGERLFEKKSLWESQSLCPYNPTSGYSYKGGNRFRLLMAAAIHGYKDPRWLTYRQAQEAGYQVKRSQKSTMLEKWIFTKEVKKTNEKGETKKELEKLKRPIVNYFRVFNAEQMDGIDPLPKQEPLPKNEMLEVADAFIQSSECNIKEEHQNRAYYSPKTDEIVLPPRDFFKNQESFLSVTLHEMAHSTGHESRLNRPLINRFGTPDYAREELVAELTGTFIQADLNIHLDGELLEDHADYLQSWIQILRNDPNELFRACNNAEKASQYLMDQYEHELNQYVKFNESQYVPEETQTKLARIDCNDGMNYLVNCAVLNLGETKLESMGENMEIGDHEI